MEHDYRSPTVPMKCDKVVRLQLKHGVDVIKIHATGGVMSRGDQPGAPQYSVDELRARSRKPTPPVAKSRRTRTERKESKTPSERESTQLNTAA